MPIRRRNTSATPRTGFIKIGRRSEGRRSAGRAYALTWRTCKHGLSREMLDGRLFFMTLCNKHEAAGIETRKVGDVPVAAGTGRATGDDANIHCKDGKWEPENNASDGACR